jgi:hypothetical protein
MVHHVSLFKLKPEVSAENVDEMIRRTRSLLLRIPEALNVRSGKRIESDAPFPFFFSVDFESRAKQRMFRDDPIYLKFLDEVVRPFTAECVAMDYEMDPGKDVKYS